MSLIERCAAAWAEVDRLRATTVDREHFDRKIREWIALYDEEQAKRRAAEQQLQGAVSALASLRAAWDEHMKTCPQHANAPSMAEIDAWMKAPSNTASAQWIGGER